MKKNQIFLLIAIVLFGFSLSSCTKYTSRIKGQGPVVTQSFDMPPISAVGLSIDANIYLTQGDSQIVRIEGQQNIINNIEKYVSPEGMWSIGYYNSVKNHAGIRIYITTNRIDYATISGSGNIETSNHFSDSANVYLGISGSGNLNMSTDANLLETVISGSGNVYLNGEVFENSINISGSGDVKAFGLNTINTYARISGSGNCEVVAEEYLNVDISGSGNVKYKGNPDIDGNISGSGSILNWN